MLWGCPIRPFLSKDFFGLLDSMVGLALRDSVFYLEYAKVNYLQTGVFCVKWSLKIMVDHEQEHSGSGRISTNIKVDNAPKSFRR